MKLLPVLIAGGAGTRLWPVSRESFPKPFMRLDGTHSLLQKTLQRSAPFGEDALIVANKEYTFKIAEEVESLHAEGYTPKVSQLLEPFGRNTAPAIAAAALWAQARFGNECVMLVLPADHLIADQAGFEAAVHTAAQSAADGALTLFGIQPTAPETGFGYLEAGPVVAGTSCRAVQRFVEKPDRATAMQYLQSGQFLWNSGMFCLRVDRFLAALAEHAPDVDRTVRAAWAAVSDANKQAVKVELPEAEFAGVPDISVDYAVMERTAGLQAVPASFGWSDIGSWTAVSETFVPDAAGNTAQGNALFVGSKNSHVQSSHRLIAAVGLEDIVVIDTEDAVLVAHKDKSQDVKAVVAELKARNDESVKLHRTVHRPWGSYTVMEEGPRFKIKRIEVKPGASLSLQMHYQRSEHWIVVSGTAKVVNGEREYLVPTGESTFIPVGNVHRLANPGKTLLAIIEVQCGDYLGEDDIVRMQDNYGRVQ